MPVRFILGRAGSGKTHHCIAQIVEAARAEPLGRPIFFVVPRQATFAAQRRLACGGDLTGFCRIRVVSFDLLAETILAECGGEATPTLTPRGRRIIHTHLLRKLADKLIVYRSAAARIGLADELDATFSELEHNGYGVEHLTKTIEELSANDPAPQSAAAMLRDKLHDLRLIYDAYQAFLGEDRVDPHRRLQQVLHAIGQSPSLARAAVYIDGFLDFSDFERQLIAAMGNVCREVNVTMLLDPTANVVVRPHLIPDELGLFHRTERAYRKLYFALSERDVQLAAPLLLDHASRGRAEDLAAVEHSAFGLERASDARYAGSIELLQLSDRRAEIDAAAVTIRKWLRAGFRPREVAVLSRHAGDIHELIEATFNEHQIPFFADRRRPAAHHPLLQTVRAMLSAARLGCPHEAMMTLLKCGLFPIDRPDADRLENFVLEHNLQGHAWTSDETWRFDEFRDTDDDADDSDHHAAPAASAKQDCESLRLRIITPLEPLRMAFDCDRAPLHEFATAVMESLQSAGAMRQMARWIEDSEKAEQFEISAEHQQVWSQWIELLDEVVELVGDEPHSPAEFCELIESALAGFDLAIAPATLDQVIVGEFERTRFEHFRGVILLGWNEAAFPRAAAEPSVLGDSERRDLSRRRIELENDTQRRLLDESLLAYLAVTRAQEKLVITRTLADESGREIAASTFWRQIVACLPRLEAVHAADSPSQLPKYSTPRKVVDALSRWARRIELDDTDVDADAASLYQSIVTAQPPIERLASVLAQAWPALSHRNTATLSAETVGGMYSSALVASVSRIEAFANCPYKHFAQYTLRLRRRPEPDVSQLDLGNLYHQVLERLVASQIQRKQKWDPRLRPAAAEISAVAAEVSGALRGRIMLASSRNQFLVRQMEGAIDEVMHRQHTAGGKGTLSPSHVELTFGPEGADLPPLKLHTPKARTVTFQGKVDRVDIDPATGALAVFDYKLRRADLDLGRVYHGLALQLLTYLLVLEANGEHLAGRKLTPVAAFYVKLMRDVDRVDHPSEAEDANTEAFALKLVQNGVFHLDHVTALDPDSITPGCKSKIVHFGRTKDGEITKKGNDSAAADEFAALVNHVRETLARMTDQIIDGVIDIRPRRLGDDTPCPYCDFRPLCRFDFSAGDRYLDIEKLSRDEVLTRLTVGGNP